MAATVSSYANALKQVWTADHILEQLYTDNPFLERVEKTDRFMIGSKALVPIHTDRAGAYSAMPAGGGTLNAAQQQGLGQPQYDLTHHYQQVSIESAAVDQVNGNTSQAVASVVDYEVQGAVENLRKNLNRQAFSNGDALIAKCGTTSAATTVVLDTPANGAYGYDGIVRGWLFGSSATQGAAIDIGTTASEASIASNRIITGVSESATAPTITISGAAVTTSTSHFISIHGARSGTTSYEMNGLRNVVSQTASLGGVSASGVWQAADVDTSTTAITLDAIYTERRKVQQKTGKVPTYAVTSLKQEQNITSLLQAQVRFEQPDGLNTSVPGVSIGSLNVQAHPDCPDSNLFLLTLEDLFIVGTPKPRWMSDIQGANQGLLWSQGATNFVDAVSYRINLCCKRRNSHAALTGLTA